MYFKTHFLFVENCYELKLRNLYYLKRCDELTDVLIDQYCSLRICVFVFSIWTNLVAVWSAFLLYTIWYDKFECTSIIIVYGQGKTPSCLILKKRADNQFMTKDG